MQDSAATARSIHQSMRTRQSTGLLLKAGAIDGENEVLEQFPESIFNDGVWRPVFGKLELLMEELKQLNVTKYLLPVSISSNHTVYWKWGKIELKQNMFHS